jgi:uncharacterized repeat protein (TIGR03806 family)
MLSTITSHGRLVLMVLFACSLTSTSKGLLSSTTRPTNTSCFAPPKPAARVQVARVYPQLRFDQPVGLASSRNGAWWFVAERRGRIWRFAANDDVTAAEVVLDLSDRVDASSEAIGLLAIALHPEFEQNGVLFASYTARGGTVVTSRVSRFVSHDSGRSFDAGDEAVLELDQISAYHVNADLRFGPDGYLYVGFGDGGPQGDPLGRAQDPHSWKGKILRLDVDAKSPYAIPDDNPFVRGGGAPEVWALGLRNPWRFTFDRRTGELWAGDVGGDHAEEINLIVPGGNYGWNLREGTRCMGSRCSAPNLIDPVAVLAHPEVSSITLGVAYRGASLPGLEGHLIYGDYASGVIWSIDPSQREARPALLHAGGHAPVAFAEDVNGEVLLVDYRGTLWRLVPGNTGPPDVPRLLSATGCFRRGGVPAPGLVPYEINAEFWADGASKQRWFAIPDGTAIGVDRDGRLDLPIGSVAIKEFRFASMRVETRLLVRHDDGEWVGYTYRWDARQDDATLVPLAATPTTDAWSGRWYYPHRAECMRCHRAAGGYTLGLELAQLARQVDHRDGHSIDQLATFERMGLFTGPLPETKALPSGTKLPTEQRARAWLHANCAYCHQPGATGQGEMDLRYSATLAQMNVCNVTPRFGDFEIIGAKRVVPGDPDRSTLVRRIRASGFARMPPLGTFTHDPQGRSSVEEWVRQLSCSGR